jgi:pyrroline-5-carboxylate reductase
MNKTTVGIIGGGNMGMAIINGIRRQFHVLVSEKDPARSQVLKKKYRLSSVDILNLVKKSHVIVLAVKPQDFEDVLSEINEFVSTKHLIISIAAGITCSYIEKRLPQGTRVIRTMPNLPAQVGMGVTAICCGLNAKKSDLTLAQKIFQGVGETLVVQERLIDAITAVSGSGPAYVFLFVECLLSAAQELGLNSQDSRTLVLETLKGSLKMLETSSEDPLTLRLKVTSKGGTTQAATDVFMKYNMELIFNEALKAAANRAKELSK